MAGQRRTAAAIRCAAGLGLAAALLASGCASPKASDTTARDIRRTLDGRAAAVLGHDRSAYLAALDPEAAKLRATQSREFQNLADIPLESWEYRLGDVRRQGKRAVAQAELLYRIAGYDTAPVTASRTLELGERDGRWYVTAERAGRGGAQQLWQQGDVQVVRGGRSLVLGVGQDPVRLRALAATADRAVPAVSDAWPSKWAGRVVVLAPASLDAMGALLGAAAAGYRGIAAVTTGETGAPGTAPADRVIVNPQAYAVLGAFGQDIVLTHETTHVATRAHTSAATPMWLSEGFADWVAYRGTGSTAGRIAPELQRAVRLGDVPATLPDDKDFGFAGDADRLARAYEGGWLACQLISARWGEERLAAFYRAVGEGKHRAGAVEKAMSDVLGTTPEEFTVRWREYLRERLGG
ncbi:hypothetical protein HRW14_04230 [Streptomyces lunaelactis]|uniref:hypothetical protein n=1 Tax=Streptomyces lunaelactis TaxID=1535768 RepID=UPI001584EC6C|nr:hypothetical protein [Streptomyces lunaelactis]NUK49511.1 hypothetical protein [Streptomyces lunaelactis]NUK63758.1 hypothetical protein [Streptomyces lunaelactis]